MQRDREALCLSVCFPLCLFASLSVCFSVSLPLCLFACLSVCISASLPLCLFASVSFPLCRFASLSLCIYVSLPLCLSVRGNETEIQRDRETNGQRGKKTDRRMRRLRDCTNCRERALSTSLPRDRQSDSIAIKRNHDISHPLSFHGDERTTSVYDGGDGGTDTGGVQTLSK